MPSFWTSNIDLEFDPDVQVGRQEVRHDARYSNKSLACFARPLGMRRDGD